MIDRAALLAAFQADRELLHKLRRLTATIRIDVASEVFDIRVEDGRPAAIGPASGAAEVTISGPRSFWDKALVALPDPGYESLSSGAIFGARIEGPFYELVAPWQGALHRLFVVLRETIAGNAPVAHPDSEPYRTTDCAVGRYVWVRSGESEARVYYEQAGSGPVTLVLQHTAGADGRQYRHMLANPDLQARFRMIAWDLPMHGKSLPPAGQRWWEESYRPTKAELMDWTVAICEALALDRPVYLGTSVGGQLALDLAAHHAERFRGFVSVNGWYEMSALAGYDPERIRHPRCTSEFYSARMLASTTPTAPQAAAQETYWIYRSNFPGVYAGDNDYFTLLHDLRQDGNLIDVATGPVYAVAGEYDATMLFPEHGAAALPRHVPGIEFRELKGLGHFAPSDDPASFCEAIIPLLDELLAKAA